MLSYLRYSGICAFLWLIFALSVIRLFSFLDNLELILEEKFIREAVAIESESSVVAFHYLSDGNNNSYADCKIPDNDSGIVRAFYKENKIGLQPFSQVVNVAFLHKLRTELEILRRQFPPENIFCFSENRLFFADKLFLEPANRGFITYRQYFRALLATADLMQAGYEYESENFYHFLLYFKRALVYVRNQKELAEFFGFSVMEALYPRPYYEQVQKFCNLYGLDEALVYAIMREESHFNPRAESGVGALGLMQIMPSTGRYINNLMLKEGAGEQDFIVEMLFEPVVNISYGTFYLSYLFRRFNFSVEQAVAAYNAGPGSSTKWLEKAEQGNRDFFDSIGFSETRKYSLKVLRARDYYRHIYYGGNTDD